MKCINHPCRSPIACKGFGYCREMNHVDGLARRALDSMTEKQKDEMWKRVNRSSETSLKEIAETFKKNAS